LHGGSPGKGCEATSNFNSPVPLGVATVIFPSAASSGTVAVIDVGEFSVNSAVNEAPAAPVNVTEDALLKKFPVIRTVEPKFPGLGFTFVIVGALTLKVCPL
jgi:hypothetical protein